MNDLLYVVLDKSTPDGTERRVRQTYLKGKLVSSVPGGYVYLKHRASMDVTQRYYSSLGEWRDCILHEDTICIEYAWWEKLWMRLRGRRTALPKARLLP